MKIDGKTQVWIKPNVLTEDYSLHGEAVELRRTDDGMVQVLFTKVVWVHEDDVEAVQRPCSS